MKAPWRKRPSRLENLLTIGRLDNDTNQVQRGGTRFARVATRSGKVAHLMHPTKGVLCPDMRDWPADQWQAAPSSLPLHGRCTIAAGISEEDSSDEQDGAPS